ncbi:MAG: ERF superfamily protein [Podoviridae sp. ctKoA10]|nr:MAG: ERF superfamily protein [Podoviridae sp. ctKoA10]
MTTKTATQPRNIYQRINAVMQEIDYIKKDKKVSGGGANYSAVSHDQVVAMLRDSLVKHGIVYYPEQLNSTVLVARDKSKDIAMMLYEGEYNVHFVNIDDGADRLTVRIVGHANDNGDKAPGKAVTYATKSALLKVFAIETGENDESRNYKEPEIVYATPQQVSAFYDLLTATGTDESQAMQHACINVLKYGQVYGFAQLPEQHANIVIGLLDQKLKRMEKEKVNAPE